MSNISKKSTLKKVWGYIAKYRFWLIFSLVLSAITVIMTLYIPILIGQAIDCIIEKGNVDFAKLKLILLQASAICLFTGLIQWVLNTINNKITFEIVRNLRTDAFNKIAILPLSYIDNHSFGDVVSRVIADADSFSDGLLLGFTQLFTGALTILGTLVFMLIISPWIALVVVLLTPLSLFVAKFIASKTYSMFKLQSQTKGEQTALIDEMILNQKVVQAFCYQDDALARFDEVNERLESASLKATFFSSLTNPSTRFINSIVYASVALVGALSVISGGLTAGVLSSLLSYANQYTKPFNEISGVITELQNSIACAARIFELIEQEPQKADNADALELMDVKGEVNLDKVYFSYNKSKPLIEDLNLAVKKGQRVAIVGPTGCGKTTIINLLMRFYDISSGGIEVDGKNILDIKRASLRKNYGMVLQETWLQEGSILDNIKMGRPEASFEEVVQASKDAHAHSFIMRLSDGYDTVISEDGGDMSQGQKQLLCIARIMLSLPPMLILDEATSSIDTRTELKIQDAFCKMMKGRTSFIVAHRLSTIRTADVILVMKAGKIIESGSHQELLEKKGFYYTLYNSQFAK